MLRRWCFQEELGSARWLCSKASHWGHGISFHLGSRVVSIPIVRWCGALRAGAREQGAPFSDGTRCHYCARHPGDVMAWLSLTAGLLFKLASFLVSVLRSCLRAPVSRCLCFLGFVAAHVHPCIMPELFVCCVVRCCVVLYHCL